MDCPSRFSTFDFGSHMVQQFSLGLYIIDFRFTGSMTVWVMRWKSFPVEGRRGQGDQTVEVSDRPSDNKFGGAWRRREVVQDTMSVLNDWGK